MEASERMQKYFGEIDTRVRKAYEIANAAKAKGFDPDSRVEVPLAKNMAERVEGLISASAPEIVGKGVVARIAELENQYGSQDWRVAMRIAEEVATEKFCTFESRQKAIETGIRVGFAYVTVGVVSSPLEGFAGLQFKKRNSDGKEYFSLLYSGPVRSAGGTGAAVSVLIADYIRKKMGYSTYDPTEEEVKRACIEIEDYQERVTNLQYFPSKDEVAFMSRNLPVQVDGDGTAEIEVSNHKGLPRIESNRIRGGFCLVIAECLCAKAKKLDKQLQKWGKDMDMEQWLFLSDFLKLQDRIKAKGAAKKSDALLSPDYTYIKDIVAGRPVLAYPLRNGGFRLRYGRGRSTGLSSDAIHPATTVILDSYIAIGTQLKTERPGKSTTLSVCDTIDGPVVKLKGGSVRRVETMEDAKKYVKDVEEILYIGDILANYGDFLNRNHKLVPCGFNEEWWIQYVEKHMAENNLDANAVAEQAGIGAVQMKELLEKPMNAKFGFENALKLARATSTPLHPRWIYYWNSISPEQFSLLFDALAKSVIEPTKIIAANINADAKRALELIGVQHTVVSNEYVVIEGDDASALLANLGDLRKKPDMNAGILEMINSISPVKIKDKCGTFIGARMGRPEKAKMRQMKGSPQVLFPVGSEGGRMRSFQSAVEKGFVTGQFPIYACAICGKEAFFSTCDYCGGKTKQMYFCKHCVKETEKPVCEQHGPCMPFRTMKIDIASYYGNVLKRSGAKGIELVKGIRGTSNKEHLPEHLMKGILRAKHGIYVNKDGTIRYDMTEMSCTHFKPKEVGVTTEKLRDMGYETDCYGKPLESEEQILEIKPQDVILPACDNALDEGADSVIFRIACFVDDVLEKLYGLQPYYKAQKKEDMVGQLCVAMSPHTAAGIVCRIAGFSKTQGFMAHPLIHCIMRRDCDGDEAAVMLLMDHLLNFSRKYLPDKRGATQDAPLVLTSKLIPSEVDDMIFDMDTAWKYPLALYEAAEQYKAPSEVKVEVFRSRLGSEGQYENMGFTHDVADFNKGARCSAYKSAPSMKDKVLGQMNIAAKARAVEADDVARLVIERHFIRDIKGNLRKFSMQEFRCVNCNEKFRRPPLKGRCPKCDGKILFTISEGSVVKYLEPVEDLVKKYKLSPYLQQSVELTRARIESVFGRAAEKQEALNKWFT